MKTLIGKAIGPGATAALTLGLASAAQAHHFAAKFDTTRPVSISGKVVRFDRVNPHSYLYLEFETPEGRVQWAVEGPAPRQLDRMGFEGEIFAPGDSIEACGYVLKEGPQNPELGIAQLLVAEVLVFPNGATTLWSPYGTLCRAEARYELRAARVD